MFTEALIQFRDGNLIKDNEIIEKIDYYPQNFPTSMDDIQAGVYIFIKLKLNLIYIFF